MRTEDLQSKNGHSKADRISDGSFSERFGITITYSRPQKNLYLEIVHALAEQNGLDITMEELDAQAEQFALQKSGRSARAAKQLIDQLLTQRS